MGIPFLGNLGGNNEPSVEDRTGAAGDGAAAVAAAAAAASSESAQKSLELEDRARKALECPCVADLRDGPCGEQFSAAFVCFVKSQAPEKGSECLESFMRMQNCMSANSESFMSGDKHSDGEGRNDNDDGGDGIGAGKAASEEVLPLPPEVPKAAIRFPPWYIKKVLEEYQ